MSTTETIVFIDEIEDRLARLVLDERVFHLPRALLPAEAHEGQWLRISVASIPAPPSQGEARRRRLGENDPGGNVKL